MPQAFPQPPQQDFVLYDQPRPRSRLNLPSSDFPNSAKGQIYGVAVNQTSLETTTSELAIPSDHRHSFYTKSALGRKSRPPVPLFSHPRTVSLPQSPVKMDIRDLGLEDFAGLDSGTMPSTAFSSPGLAVGYEVTGSASSSVVNVGTVSPQDLLVHEPYMSAPNSTALTALTSPSMYDGSPDFNDPFNMSPSLGSCDFDSGSNDPWFPLFPPEPSLEPALPTDHPAPGSGSMSDGSDMISAAKKEEGYQLIITRTTLVGSRSQCTEAGETIASHYSGGPGRRCCHEAGAEHARSTQVERAKGPTLG